MMQWPAIIMKHDVMVWWGKQPTSMMQ